MDERRVSAADRAGAPVDPDWTDREAEGQPGTEDQPPGYTADTAVEGSFPPRDHPLVADDWGTTPRERRIGESLEQRIAREQPDSVAEEERPAGGAAAEEAALHQERP